MTGGGFGHPGHHPGYAPVAVTCELRHFHYPENVAQSLMGNYKCLYKLGVSGYDDYHKDMMINAACGTR